MMAACDGHPKKEEGEWQMALAPACDRLVYGSIDLKKIERRPLAIDRSSFRKTGGKDRRTK